MVPKGHGDRARSKIPAIPGASRAPSEAPTENQRCPIKTQRAPARPPAESRQEAETKVTVPKRGDIDGGSTKPLLIGSFWAPFEAPTGLHRCPRDLGWCPGRPPGLLGGGAKKALEAAMTGENQSAKVQGLPSPHGRSRRSDEI